MGAKSQTAEEVRRNLGEQLDWHFAERNDEAVAQALQRGEAVDAMYTLDEAGLLDGFFAFLQEASIMEHWSTFVIEGVRHMFLPAVYFLLLYGTRVLFGIESTNGLPSLLFSNVAVMSLIGFNAWQVTNGMTRRGAKQRRTVGEYTLMDPQTLADTICKASGQELERLFNGTIHGLAAFGVFMAEAMVAVDGTQVVTTRQFAGCGCLAVTKRKRTRQGTRVEVVELVFGWRLIALLDLVTLIPLAIKLVQIQAHEAPYLVELVQQAQANLEPYSRIRWLVVDRAYVDGSSLYQLHRMGITFVLIAKVDMVARATALALSAEAPTYERVEVVRHGQGRAAWSEDRVTRVVPVSGIRTWEDYAPPKAAGERLPIAERPALNAVVVTLWRNKPPSKQGPRVYLTNGPVENPWTIVDAYDDRSWIENGLFRDNKQFLRLTRWFPKKNEAGVRSHVTFVMMMFATATAYRLWDKAQAGASHQPVDHQIGQVSYRIVAVGTGELTDMPKPVNPVPTHLASIVAPQLPPGAAVHLTGQEQHPGLWVTADAPEFTNQDSAPLSESAPLDSLEEDIEQVADLDPADFLAHSLLGGQGLARWRRQLKRENRNKVIVFVGRQYGIFDLHQFALLVGVNLRDPLQQAPVRRTGTKQSGIP